MEIGETPVESVRSKIDFTEVPRVSSCHLLINTALEIHADDPADGYRFIADELAGRGFTASRSTEF